MGQLMGQNRYCVSNGGFMTRGVHRLTAVKVNKLKRPGYHSDGGGLFLRIKDGGAKSWIYRFMLDGRRRDCGLGKYPAVSLARARELAEEGRRLVAAGIDPIDRRAKDREAERAKAATAMTFEACAREYIAAHEPAWTNAEHRRLWWPCLCCGCQGVRPARINKARTATEAIRAEEYVLPAITRH